VRLLLDTHTLLWFYLGDPQLSAAVRRLIEDPGNTKFVSPASYWELAIKIGLGKYILKESYDDFTQHAIFDNGFLILPVEPKHTAGLISLPTITKIPSTGCWWRKHAWKVCRFSAPIPPLISMA